MGFETDIQPLFRDLDRNNMTFAFDLWSHDDVKENASEILVRVEDASMPCDEPWDKDKIEKPREWINAGCQP
jgi:hypothetical protein